MTVSDTPTAEAAHPVYPPGSEVVSRAHIDGAGYAARYAASVSDPDAFWGEAGQRLDWIRPY
ncbi:MAG: acetyl-coenzyme A synthetase N-terminal domain-containing protein, partial [Pseudomonadota bacterium]